MSPYYSHARGWRMNSLAHSSFGSPGVLFHIPGSLSPSLKILDIIPKKQTYKRALQRRYLERTCVHACIQLCTRGYTVVYTRVYSSLLGRRYTLGFSTPRTRILLSSAYTPSRPCPRTMVILCVSPIPITYGDKGTQGGCMPAGQVLSISISSRQLPPLGRGYSSLP